jgi:hypothetical protein
MALMLAGISAGYVFVSLIITLIICYIIIFESVTLSSRYILKEKLLINDSLESLDKDKIENEWM